MATSNLKLLGRMKFLSEARRLEWYPPFWMMRIRVLELDDSWSHARILLPLTWVSANMGGNIFGGFQANLADPIPAIACVKRFPGYRIVTKKLEIDFIRVGNSDLTLRFDFSDAMEAEIRRELEEHGRANPCFEMSYVREDGEVCSVIRNTIAIRPRGYVGTHEHKGERNESKDTHE